MTEEYYYIEEITEIDSPKPAPKPKYKRDYAIDPFQIPGPKQSQEIRLQEIEHELQVAESRCNTLKGQVDMMKVLYGGSQKDIKSIKGIPKTVPLPVKRQSLAESTVRKTKIDKDCLPEKDVPNRDVNQNCRINTSKTAATCPQLNASDASDAVKSINNLITGITNSVNRLTQLQVNIGSTSHLTNDLCGIQNIECCPRSENQQTRPEKPYQDIKLDKKSKKKIIKPTRKKSHSKHNLTICKSESKKLLKSTAKHIEKKTKISLPISAGVTTSKLKSKFTSKMKAITSKTSLLKKTAQPPLESKTKTDKVDNLIELYHNSAAKILGSDESLIQNRKNSRYTVSVNKQCAEKIEDKIKNPLTQPESRIPITEYNMPGELPRIGVGLHGSYYKNYELPTIASKMKHVARNYFENFSFRSIPFVTAKSITPSHNLGINIQQVLSIIKGRKPVAGISPTLAYNIELAANKLGSRPLSALVSTLGSRMNNKFCPLTRRYPNFSHLQEMAKEIPEETVEEIENCSEVKPTTSLAAGDKPEKAWVNDIKDDKCTCVPKTGVSFNEVYSKYVVEDKPKTMSYKRPLRNKPWNSYEKFLRNGRESVPLTNTRSTQLNRKEKSLKEILKNLYEEFGSLNDRYDELKAQVNINDNKSNTDILQELNKMEKILQNKEDEITMVMSLYSEVTALKQQVRVLKKRASQSTVLVSPYAQRQREYKDLNAAGHLTKLLRHIQQFQGTLKNKPSV